MIFLVIVGIAIYMMVCVVISAVAYFGIPEGWEDENGFHYGRKQ